VKSGVLEISSPLMRRSHSRSPISHRRVLGTGLSWALCCARPSTRSSS
jgi:hypothetical protein